MRLATWNVNSVTARLPRLLEWLDGTSPYAARLQETKTSDFPVREVGDLGYRVAALGSVVRDARSAAMDRCRSTAGSRHRAAPAGTS